VTSVKKSSKHRIGIQTIGKSEVFETPMTEEVMIENVFSSGGKSSKGSKEKAKTQEKAKSTF